MIQTTRPPAASRKWLRIRGGRIRLPPSCCWRIPPRINQIESSTKPPPAVITQAISAAHFITPPFGSHPRASRSLKNDGLYTAKKYLSSIGLMTTSPAAEREQDAAVQIITIAARRIAHDLIDVDAVECPRGKRRPHASVDRR